MSDTPSLILVMGVSGSGKSTLARMLAGSIGADFMEADDYHSDEAREQMAAGKPLDNAMREPWIERMLEAACAKLRGGSSVVLAYSGLKQQHRKRFYDLEAPVSGIMLSGAWEVIEHRIRSRSGHYATESLLDSQFASMQPLSADEPVVTLDLDCSLEALHNEALRLCETWKRENA